MVRQATWSCLLCGLCSIVGCSNAMNENLASTTSDRRTSEGTVGTTDPDNFEGDPDSESPRTRRDRESPRDAGYVAPELEGRIVVSHLVDDSLLALDATTLAEGATHTVEGSVGELLAVPELDVLVVGREGGSEVEVLSADDLKPIDGSPYPTGLGPVDFAYDAERSLLFVYCIGTIGRPEESLVTVYDTSTTPYEELPGSPFDIDVAGKSIEVDPETGRLFGVSDKTVWAVELVERRLRHVSGSPLALEDLGREDGTGFTTALDVARRRFFFNVKFAAQEQALHSFDIDSFEEVRGSPLHYGQGLAGDIELNPYSGVIFLIDYLEARLYVADSTSMKLLDACGGGAGCKIPPTETGLSLDYDADRLFILHVHDLEKADETRGFMSAWDVSDPGMPDEITDEDDRPKLSYYPVTAVAL